MNSPTAKVCENLAIFGFSGFVEKTEAHRFKRDKELNWKDRDRVHWIQYGRHLPRPRTGKASGTSKSSRPPVKKRTKVKISKTLAKELLSL